MCTPCAVEHCLILPDNSLSMRVCAIGTEAQGMILGAVHAATSFLPRPQLLTQQLLIQQLLIQQLLIQQLLTQLLTQQHVYSHTYGKLHAP